MKIHAVSRERVIAILPALLGMGVFTAAMLVLERELAQFHVADIEAHLASITARSQMAAGALTVASYVALTGYDVLAFRWVGGQLSYWRIALASFVGFVFSHNIGLASLGGNAARYRILTTSGVDASDVARVVTFNLITFWIGFLGLGGSVLAWDPIALPAELHLPLVASRPIGLALVGALAAYVTLTAVRRSPVRIAGFAFSLPRPAWAAAQSLLSAMDWVLAAAAFWVLLPANAGVSFGVVLGAYLLAQVVGLVSHVPGGLGVFEGVMVLLLRPYLPAHVVLGSAIAYRLIYYLAPLVVGLLMFAGYETVRQRRWLAASREVVSRWLPEVVPRALSVSVLIAGLVLLLSGATPPAAGRSALLSRFLPLPAIELSHLLGSVTGVALLLVARALQQRLDGAYFLALVGLGAGAIASLAKGLDYKEAGLLALMFLALLPCRRFFYRRSSLLSESFSPEWSLGIALAVGGTLAVTLLAYRHIEYSHELWWQFEFQADAPRAMRALFAASLAVIALGIYRLLRSAPPEIALPDERALEAVRPLVAASPQSQAHLALLGDKHLLLHEGGAGFLMYGIEGRCWIAMGDPVGPPDVRRELAWTFQELADAHGARAAFYEVGAEDLPIYLDLGFVLRKLGEEALVPLRDFSLEGGHRSRLRQARSRMTREGCHFEVLPAESVPPLLDALEAVSAEWLSHKHTREKHFSLGGFERAYLSRTPLAVIRRAERIVAFANVWPSGEHNELSVDLMRYGSEAPPATMDALFTELMLWGQTQGYQWFSLGMAPLSGFEQHRLAPPWNRLGALLFRYGEHFYNFQGLREFKEKFAPVWRPRYLAAPGALAVPLVLTRVAALVNGGVTGAVAR